ncbi:hypothetical protein GIX45_29240 [Erwinia sp. CPCC 100877]|nr:hypothetical protein [Erwinia sp. CPCC 100877]
MGEITHHQQVRLFEITYSDYVADARSFYIKHKRPNAIPWERMDEKLREVFVDMKY